MTAQQVYRWGPRDFARPIDLDARPFPDGAAATVVDDNGTTVLTVRSWTEQQPTGVPSLGRVTVVAADGDIDADTVSLLSHVLGHALDRGRTVCFDLSGVTFFGAAAARLLLGLQKRVTGPEQLFVRGVHGMTEVVLAVVDPYRVVPRH